MKKIIFSYKGIITWYVSQLIPLFVGQILFEILIPVFVIMISVSSTRAIFLVKNGGFEQPFML